MTDLGSCTSSGTLTKTETQAPQRLYTRDQYATPRVGLDDFSSDVEKPLRSVTR